MNFVEIHCRRTADLLEAQDGWLLGQEVNFFCQHGFVCDEGTDATRNHRIWCAIPVCRDSGMSLGMQEDAARADWLR